MVNPEGEITSLELHAPFTYLKSLADDLTNNNSSEGGSSFVQLRPQSQHCVLLIAELAILVRSAFVSTTKV
jgi:hypothetical protein